MKKKIVEIIDKNYSEAKLSLFITFIGLSIIIFVLCKSLADDIKVLKEQVKELQKENNER